MTAPTERLETGAEELRKVVRVLGNTNESALDPFTAEELLRIVRACLASPWDITPDFLTLDERRYAAEHGALSREADARLDEVLS